MKAVSGYRARSLHAQLNNFACYRIKNAIYPAIISRKNEMVSGVLYKGIKPFQLQRIDAYESEMYDRVLVKVISEKNIKHLRRIFRHQFGRQ